MEGYERTQKITLLNKYLKIIKALASVSDDRSIKLWELVQGFAPTLGVEASVEYWKDVFVFIIKEIKK